MYRSRKIDAALSCLEMYNPINIDSRMSTVYRYLFIDASGDIRGKTRVDYSLADVVHKYNDKNNTRVRVGALYGSFPEVPIVELLPIWNFDGSSTGQASGDDSEVFLVPMALFPDPVRRGGVLVLSETYLPDPSDPQKMVPHPDNHRRASSNLLNKKLGDGKTLLELCDPWFGLEQEFTILERNGDKPYNWLSAHDPGMGDQGPYYCSYGGDRAFGRPLVDQLLECCRLAGVKIKGTNAEVMPSQWEFQIGPCHLLEIGDHVTIARWILMMLSETALDRPVSISIAPRTLSGDWNGNGGHMNFSTKQMRETGGYPHIEEAIEKLREGHDAYSEVWGKGNEERLSGKHETCSHEEFRSGVADRTASIRIPRQVHADQKGYLEDRRPGGNIDPYELPNRMVETICL